MSAAPDIPVLPHTEQTVEELVRLVQECGDVVRRKDTAALLAASHEMKTVLCDIIAMTDNAPFSRSTEMVRRMFRPMLLLYMAADDVASKVSDADAARLMASPEVKRIRDEVLGSKPDMAPTTKPAPGHRIVEQIKAAIETATSDAEAQSAAAERYRLKAKLEPDRWRGQVYALLGNASQEVADRRQADIRTWRFALGFVSAGEKAP